MRGRRIWGWTHARRLLSIIVAVLVACSGAIALALGDPEVEQRVYFMSINEAKFRKPVVPGDTLYYHLRLLQRRRTVWRFAGVAKVDGETVAEAEMTAMITDAV